MLRDWQAFSSLPGWKYKVTIGEMQQLNLEKELSVVHCRSYQIWVWSGANGLFHGVGQRPACNLVLGFLTTFLVTFVV